jgi:orotate phosphoribosyltransferase
MKHEALARMLLDRSFLERPAPEPPFILASGKESRHYFDCDRTTSFAPALPLLAAAFRSRLLPGVAAVGGPTRGADPIATAIAFGAALDGQQLRTFSVRKERKDHGIVGWLEGSAIPGEKVALLEDVVTSGGSVIRALERCREEGLTVVQILLLLDREEGGLARVQAAAGDDVPVEALLRYSEVLALRSEQAR